MILNKLNYIGIVTIEVERNNKKIRKRVHNRGEEILFELFAKTLAGLDVSHLLPTFFKMSWNKDDVSYNSPLIPILSSYRPEITYIGMNVKKNICRLQCNLPLSRIGTDNLTQEVYTLNILSKEEEILATVEIENSPFANLNSSDQVIILWDLYVTNFETDASSTEENDETTTV